MYPQANWAHPVGHRAAVLIDEGVGIIPDPTQAVCPVLAGVQQLHVIENGTAPVLKQDL